MNTALGYAASLVYGYVVATVGESACHEYIQHGRDGSLSQRWFSPFRTAKMSHELVHHKMTYKQDHVTQFRDAEEKANVDAYLDREHASTGMNEWVRAERYGVTLTWLSLLLYMGPFLPALLIVYWVSRDLGALAVAMVPTVVAYWHSRCVHQYMHMPYERALAECSWAMGVYLRTGLMRHIWRAHFVHHRRRTGNYNLLVGGDHLRGTYLKPSTSELRLMAQLGLPTA